MSFPVSLQMFEKRDVVESQTQLGLLSDYQVVYSILLTFQSVVCWTVVPYEYGRLISALKQFCFRFWVSCSTIICFLFYESSFYSDMKQTFSSKYLTNKF